MIKKVISYTDFDGNPRVEEFWFNLTKAEMMDLGLSKDGGYDKYIVDNLVLYDWAKTDFSDRFNEDPFICRLDRYADSNIRSVVPVLEPDK